MNFSDKYSVDTDQAVSELKRLEKAQDGVNDSVEKGAGKAGKFGEVAGKFAEGSQGLAEGLHGLSDGLEPALAGFAAMAGVIGGPILAPAVAALGFAFLVCQNNLGLLSSLLGGEARKSIKDYQEGVQKLDTELGEVQASMQTYVDMQNLTVQQGKEYQKLREKEAELNEKITKQNEAEAEAKAEIARLESLKKAEGKSADEKKALAERQIREQGGSELGDIEKKFVDQETEQTKKEAEERRKALEKNINAAPRAETARSSIGRDIKIGPNGSLTDEERSAALREAREREKSVVAKAEADARKRAQDLLIGLSKGDSGSIEQLKNAGFKDSNVVKGVESTLETGKTEADREAERIAEERAKRQREDAARAERAKKKAAPAIQKAIKEATQVIADPFEQKRSEDEAAKEAAREQEAARKERAAKWAERNQDLVDATRAARSIGQDPAQTDAALMREIERRSGYSRTGNKRKDEKSTSRIQMEKAALDEIKERAKEADSAIAESIESGVGRDNAILLYLNSIAERQRQIAQQNEQMRMRVAQARQNLAPSRPSILPTY